jgi:hypothetical protein
MAPPTVVTQRKLITQEHFEERVAIKLEAIRNPTPKQVHDAENEALEEFEELYGKFDLERWPRQR